MTDRFIHLKNYTVYSVLQGALQLQDIVDQCYSDNMPAVAITDINNMFGIMDFCVQLLAKGIQPIVGSCIAIKIDDTYSYCALLCQNEIGYQNILQIFSKIFLSNRKENVLYISELQEYSEGLICLSGGNLGPIGKLILDDNIVEAENLTKKLLDIFNDRFYLEIARHNLHDEKITENIFLDLAYRYNIPIVATNDCYFANKEIFEAHDVLMCLAQKVTISTNNRYRLTDQHFFKSTSEMLELFKDLPEAIENTINIAKRCSFILQEVNSSMPNIFGQEVSGEMLTKITFDGLKERIDKNNIVDTEVYYKRLEYELSIINNMAFADYFIIVYDFIKWSRDNNISVGPGRGSGAGSLVAWSLRITDVDPIRFGLLFERFLNPKRISMPDFDIDLCQERRNEVLHYIRNKYGDKQVAHIITLGKLQARAVLRAVGRVLEIPLGYINRICKLIPYHPSYPTTLAQASISEVELKNLCSEDPKVDKLISISLLLEGLHSHTATHAAGIVINDKPLDSIIPLYNDINVELAITQFNMKDVERIGLVKFDLLGLKTLTVLQNTIVLLKDYNIDVDFDKIDLEDKKTFKLLADGLTTSVFQLESPGMRDALVKLIPSRIEDIIAIISLYRPGPMDNIATYIARKHGKEKIVYLHPKLEKILEETYGIFVYQEQVISAAQILANYDASSADILRRAMGKKIKAEMEEQRVNFIAGCADNDIDAAKAEFIFERINSFSGYGFNKSHAASYAIISYRTAYLKANYPLHFFIANMSIDILNTDKLATLCRDANNLNITILSPDINKSQSRFSIEKVESKSCIRYGLSAIKNVGKGVIDEIIVERERNGIYLSIQDFAKRTKQNIINKRCLEYMIYAGALDCLCQNRAQIIASLDKIMNFICSVSKESQSQQANLFDIVDIPVDDLLIENYESWSANQYLLNENLAFGFFFNNNPMQDYYDVLQNFYNLTLYKNVKNKDESFYLIGVIDFIKQKVSKNNKKYCIIGVSDLYDQYKLLYFNDNKDLKEGITYLFSIKSSDNDGVKMIVDNIINCEQSIAVMVKKIIISVDNALNIPKLKEVLNNYIDDKNNNKAEIILLIEDKNKNIKINLGKIFNTCWGLISKLKNIKSVTKIKYC